MIKPNAMNVVALTAALVLTARCTGEKAQSVDDGLNQAKLSQEIASNQKSFEPITTQKFNKFVSLVLTHGTDDSSLGIPNKSMFLDLKDGSHVACGLRLSDYENGDPVSFQAYSRIGDGTGGGIIFSDGAVSFTKSFDEVVSIAAPYDGVVDGVHLKRVGQALGPDASDVISDAVNNLETEGSRAQATYAKIVDQVLADYTN